MIIALRALLDIVILIGVIGGALVSLSGLLLGAFVPLVDAVNHFQLIFLIAGCVSLGISVIWPYHFPSIKRPAQWILVVPVISASLMLAPDVIAKVTARPVDKAQVDAGTLIPVKLMSFNIYLGTWDGDGLSRSIARHKPDIVALQEFPPNRFRNNRALRAQFPHQARCQHWKRCSLGLLSKHPMKDIKRYDLGTKTLTNPMHGKMLAATITPHGGAALRVYTVHLSWPLPTREKQAQLAAMADILRKEAKHYSRQVVAGDFNSTGWAYALDRHVEMAGLVRRSQFNLSFPSPHSRLKHVLKLPAFLSLDHILTSPDLAAGPVVRASASLGDHWPILGELYVPRR